MEEEKRVEKKRLSPAATLLLTIGGVAIALIIIGIMFLIFAKLG